MCMVPYAREELIPGDGLQHPGAADEGAQGGGEGGREAAGVDDGSPGTDHVHHLDNRAESVTVKGPNKRYPPLPSPAH